MISSPDAPAQGPRRPHALQAVAQICNLLYRRFVICERHGLSNCFQIALSNGRESAGRLPAIRPVADPRRTTAFTLAEVLAALLFMAIVIPVAMEGLQIASRAGEVAQRKSSAARIAERVLNENIASTNWNQTSQAGTVTEGVREFRWTLHSEPWSQNITNTAPPTSTAGGPTGSGQPIVNAMAASQTTLNLLSVDVEYSVQNRPYSVRLSTLVNSQ
jgi:type II secretory pathway pseudopilin PulG